MKTFIVHLLCVIACIPAVAASLEDRVAEIAAAPGVAVASIVTDAQGRAEIKPMPGFDGWRTAEIRYLAITDNAVEDNTIAVIIDPDGSALWHRRLPEPLVQARRAAQPQTVGTDAEIRAAINTAMGVTLADKIGIERGETSADVTGYVETAGKLLPVHYYVARNIKTGEWIVKPYDETAITKEALAR